MRITVLLISCCSVGILAGCFTSRKSRKGPPEFLLGARAVQTSPGGDRHRDENASTGVTGTGYVDAAAALAGAAGSTVANRAIYDTCYAACPTGTACDAATGMCVRQPCGGKCPADYRCKVVEGKEACVLGEPDRGVVSPPAAPGAGELGPGAAPGDAPGPRVN
ncbi:putative secreted protein [Sorangium cellulosum So ce56]|uniref:Secreted protein n=1 Tax=Sorangium cellulosum (strain So ce56) TaxID=448385 RepID=A9EQF4_SORC5|nr:hypothetical protein [Sorangium cellulosum]CAN94133.1 putative secreted protein [Sorangium cellulosum So ce56]